MEWQQILGFYQVARLGSFTKAAEATFRTQSALSQQIKALEEELACPLLERIGKRKLRLTAAGEKFLRFAEAVLEKYQHLQEEFNEIKGLKWGHLRFAAPFTTLYQLFRDLLPAYLRRFPQVQLSILDRSQENVIELVRAGDIDFGIALESAVPKDLLTRRWHRVEKVLLTPPGHPLVSLKRVTMEEIARYPLILPPQSLKYTGRRMLEEHFHKLGVDFHIIMESSNVELSSLYVEMGLGISFATVASGLPMPEKRKLAFIPLEDYFPPDYIAVIMRKDKVLSPHKEAFLEMLFGE
ncbi:MAG: LysR family transcriptional regulator [Deltaproteobacteria bacterium RBG_13_60_28]|nr:MAG: LysR family transcriptional regulator [Deltaproteobacteria bacterium RBG_13_60_28]